MQSVKINNQKINPFKFDWQTIQKSERGKNFLRKKESRI